VKTFPNALQRQNLSAGDATLTESESLPRGHINSLAIDSSVPHPGGSAFVPSPRHWLVSIAFLVWHGHHDLDFALQPRHFIRTSHVHCIHAHSDLQIFSNMRSYMYLTVLALAAASAVFPVLSAPIQYRYENLLV
jgi:hypothetical protein